MKMIIAGANEDYARTIKDAMDKTESFLAQRGFYSVSYANLGNLLLATYVNNSYGINVLYPVKKERLLKLKTTNNRKVQESSRCLAAMLNVSVPEEIFEKMTTEFLEQE